MGKWVAEKQCPDWAGIEGWLPAFRPDLAKWGSFSHLGSFAPGGIWVLTHNDDLFTSEGAGLPISNELWKAIAKNQNLYLYDEERMSTWRKFEKVAPMLQRIADKIRVGGLDNELIFERAVSHDEQIVSELEKLLGCTIPVVHHTQALNKREQACLIDAEGDLTHLRLSRVGLKRLDKIMPHLTALEYLSSLDIPGNNITDISPLAKLEDLVMLDIRDNQISDLRPLAGLALEMLVANNNPVADLKPLARMTSLDFLYMDEAGITDISPLQGLTKLESLSLVGNKISDISALKPLKELEWLALSNNLLTDVSALQHLKNLKNVWLDDNELTSLPAWMLEWGLEIVWDEHSDEDYVSVEDNPFTAPPIRVVKQGMEAIKEWFLKNG